MSFNVRVFGHRGLSQMLLNMPKQFSSDSVFQLVQPYEFCQTISVSGTAASSSPQPVGDQTKILRIEVPDGQSVRYEINPSGRTIAAGTQSPILSGHEQFEFAQGWTISLIDAAGLP
jgi:hypothetical protein